MGESSVPLGWIPALPLLGAVILGVMRGLFRRDISSRWTALVSLGAVVSSLGLLLAAFFELLRSPPDGVLVSRMGTWMGAGIAPDATIVDFAFRLDPLSAVIALLVAGAGFLAIVQSLGTLSMDEREDRGPQRFLGFTCLALAAMLLLVLADDIFLFWAAWCGLGLSTWCLLGFWYADEEQTKAASLAFVVGRIGDATLLAAWVLMLRAGSGTDGSFSGFDELQSVRPGLQAVMFQGAGFLGSDSWTGAEVVAGLILIALLSKSALLPFSRWMIDSAKAPVPALILVQTVLSVGAPIYLGSRMSFVFSDAPWVASWAAWLGATSALFGALMACRQRDVFRLLSWSTVSQLGLALVALAAVDEAAAVFQLIAHALHKGLLLMTMGVVVAAVGGRTDIRLMGNLGSRLWRTRIDTWVAALSICGLVPATVGFFSIEQILFAIAPSEHLAGSMVLVWMVIAAIGVTAFGVMRLVYLTLYGESRIPPSIRWAGIEDPGPALLWPMSLLAVSILVGVLIAMPQIWADLLFVEIQHANSLRYFLGLDPVGLAVEKQWTLVAWASGSAWLGSAAGVWLYLYKPAWWSQITQWSAGHWWRRGHGESRRGHRLEAIWTFRTGRSGGVPFKWIRDGAIEGLVLRGGEWGFRNLISQRARRLQSGRASQYFATALLACWAILIGLFWITRG